MPPVPVRPTRARAATAALWLALALGAGCKREDAATADDERSDDGGARVSVAARVVTTRGTAEIRRGPDAPWNRIRAGDRVEVQDSVRTSPSGGLELAVGEVKIRLRERSEFRLQKVTAKRLRARVLGGIESESPEDSERALEVEAEGSDAVAVSHGGHFSMMSDGRGVVAVASVAGTVTLSAHGSEVQLQPGQVSRVRGESAPDAPSRALRKVLMSVKWPTRRASHKRVLPLEGRVEVGSRVAVRGQDVPVDAEGRFHTQVPLAQGSQQVTIRVVDVLGREARESLQVSVDTKRPGVAP